MNRSKTKLCHHIHHKVSHDQSNPSMTMTTSLIHALSTKAIILSLVALIPFISSAFVLMPKTKSIIKGTNRLINYHQDAKQTSNTFFITTSTTYIRSSLTSSDDSHNGNVDTGSGHITIEYCTGCKWLLRSAWLMQELFSTFHDEMSSITLIPSKPPAPGGTFVIKLNNEVIWDRKNDNGFPEAKELKQRVRDKVNPNKSLGHSDSKESNRGTNVQETTNTNDNGECIECNENKFNIKEDDTVKKVETFILDVKDIRTASPNIKITYCTGCRWMLRSAWMSQELLTTFEQELHSVTLVPNKIAPGTFTVTVGEKEVWDRKVNGGFPEIKVLKQRIRDEIAPDLNLGHSDKVDKLEDNVNDNESITDEMDDDQAADMRTYFGVL